MSTSASECGDARYVLGDLLGVGGMGQVYGAQGVDGLPFAIKILHPAHANDPAMIARLGDEARVGMRVHHPNVVRVVDHGTAAGGPFLVMDRVSGTSLGEILWREGVLPLRRIRSITSQILAGLAAIHRAGLVHGDLKSDNVLVDSSGGVDRVTIIDLGLARAPGTYPACDDEQILSGTPEYVAPELIRGIPITAAADIYAAGVIVYELLTGATPFGGGDASMIFERQLHNNVVPPSLRCPDRLIPPALEEVVMRALAKDPDERHRDASTFATELERSMHPAFDDVSPRARTSTFEIEPERSSLDEGLHGRARSGSSSESPTRDWMPRRARCWLAKGTPGNRDDRPDDVRPRLRRPRGSQASRAGRARRVTLC